METQKDLDWRAGSREARLSRAQFLGFLVRASGLGVAAALASLSLAAGCTVSSGGDDDDDVDGGRRRRRRRR